MYGGSGASDKSKRHECAGAGAVSAGSSLVDRDVGISVREEVLG